MIMRMIMLKMLMVMRLQRLLSPEEGLELTNCLSYKPRPPGNIASRSLFLIILVALLSLICFIFNFNFNVSSTTWNITGSLIVQKEFLESDMVCTEGRTLIIPVRLGQKKNYRDQRFYLVERKLAWLNILTRYQTFNDAMDICEELGERGSFLANFKSFDE